MATHSSILASKIPWTEEPGRLQSMGSQRVGHDCVATISLHFTWYDANTINHYMCDIMPLLKLSCMSTYVNELVDSIIAGFNIIVPSITIFVSYVFILSNILQISSKEGRSKAFGTCSSHIIAVSLFFGSISFVYLKPSSAVSMDEGKISSVFYTNTVPLLNPLIYSLRNKDVKLALRKTLPRWL